MSENRKTLKAIKALSLMSFSIGVVYLILGICDIFSKFVSDCNTLITPANVGLGIIMISIGIILVSSIATLKRNVVLSASSSLIGTGLSVSAMIIQLLAVGASWLDGIITGEKVSSNEILAGVLRGDALLGYIAVPLLIFAIKVVKENIVKS